MFDYVEGVPENSDHDNQVKCWGCYLGTYSVGGEVPNVERGVDTYSVLLRGPSHEPRYVLVDNGVITDVYSETFTDGFPVYDKWGTSISPEPPTGRDLG